jgi:thiamine pyrophosphate-dependent acetolactate synthase large subunit-like protein
MMTKLDALRRILSAFDGYLVVCCNGMIGREVHLLGDRPDRFYMIGSMGLAPAVGLGLALAQPARGVLVLDGDGNLLMGLGNLAQIAAERPGNLVHVCLDNHVHASTGGQRTIADGVPLEAIARGAGYPTALAAETEAELLRVRARPGRGRHRAGHPARRRDASGHRAPRPPGGDRRIGVSVVRTRRLVSLRECW